MLGGVETTSEGSCSMFMFHLPFSLSFTPRNQLSTSYITREYHSDEPSDFYTLYTRSDLLCVSRLLPRYSPSQASSRHIDVTVTVPVTD